MSSGTSEFLYAVWGASAADVYAVGTNGTILRYNGTSWLPMTSGTTRHLYGISGTVGGTVVAAGDAGTLVTGSGGASPSLARGPAAPPAARSQLVTGRARAVLEAAEADRARRRPAIP